MKNIALAILAVGFAALSILVGHQAQTFDIGFQLASISLAAAAETFLL